MQYNYKEHNIRDKMYDLIKRLILENLSILTISIPIPKILEFI